MEQRERFVALAGRGHFTIRQLCEEFGISRKSGHKWIQRHQAFGAQGLKDRSRAPKSVPSRKDAEIERLIVSKRRRRSTWGPKKIHQILKTKHDLESPPARSTIGEILKRNGLVKPRRRRPGVFQVERDDLTPAQRVNQVWAVDFKGWFLLGDGTICDPLTLSNLSSRYLLKVKAQGGRPCGRGWRRLPTDRAWLVSGREGVSRRIAGANVRKEGTRARRCGGSGIGGTPRRRDRGPRTGPSEVGRGGAGETTEGGRRQGPDRAAPASGDDDDT